MGYRSGLHVLSPEPSRTMPLPMLLAVGGIFAGILIAGTLAGAAIQLVKDTGDAFNRAWTGGKS